MIESMNSPSTINVFEALVAGTAMGIYYDFFRIIRRLFRSRYATIVAQDLFFWVTSAIAVFFVDIWFSGGTVRIYFIIAVLIGWGIYTATFGALLMFFADKVIAIIRRVYVFLRKLCAMLMKRIKLSWKTNKFQKKSQ